MLDVYTDACVWGLGAWLVIDGIAVEFFAIPLSQHDLTFFGFDLGDNKGQQCWETLAILVALRHWKPKWVHLRARLGFNADNVTALTAIAAFKAQRSTAVSRIARELALEISDAEFAPEFCNHIPGIANGVADTLSRRYPPGKTFVVPKELANAVDVHPVPHSDGYYRSLTPPGANSSA